jgi:signal transduction histidine kinase
VVSSEPASVAFTVLAPVWRRWWFLSAGGGLLAAALYALHRNRVRQLLALERVRTRIASDLHDDIGSTLSQIAILGEVARARIGSIESALDEPLSRIGRLSRESVDSMSDIVWAIDPHKDRMQNLAQRMRRLASEVLEARNIEFSFEAHEDRLSLGAEIRREVFLAFKEALNNVVRHSECRRVEIALRLEGPWLVLMVHDDGKGFDATGDVQGNGLRNLRRRAAALGGSMDLVSTGGTRITLRIPCRRRWFWRGAVPHPHDQVSGGSRSL